jgi:phosphatidylglycerol:prolipoprotein diacylglycerol transferase
MPLALLPFPAFKPVLVEIGPFSIGSLTLGPFAIRWYALAYIAGILLGWLYARTVIARDRYWGGPAPFTVADYDDFVLWVTLGIILGGRIGYVLFYNFDFFRANPAEMLKVWNGGMSFHGGFLGCVAAVGLFSLKRRISFLSLGDITCAVGPLGLFLGRLANFVNGELWGRPTDVAWAMIFPADREQLARHPSQLYEATLEGLVLLLILHVLIRRGALRRPGLIIGAFAMLYAVFRSFCELFREPDVQLGFLWHGTTMGMLLSIPLFLAGVGFVVYALRRQPLRST